MTQAEAAEKLRIAQSRVSDLMRGKWMTPKTNRAPISADGKAFTKP